MGPGPGPGMPPPGMMMGAGFPGSGRAPGMVAPGTGPGTGPGSAPWAVPGGQHRRDLPSLGGSPKQ